METQFSQLFVRIPVPFQCFNLFQTGALSGRPTTSPWEDRHEALSRNEKPVRVSDAVVVDVEWS